MISQKISEDSKFYRPAWLIYFRFCPVPEVYWQLALYKHHLALFNAFLISSSSLIITIFCAKTIYSSNYFYATFACCRIFLHRR
ncbi:uncharacterized protein OCT59_010163 [Rhizophagus irregularis]|uniref:uncharacterized protein n=1 Tax=Rhizophagus irregularis TaxID=588596 RepID=UPI0019DE8C84|nr:hypothetical protein OCT59_010163 [Rhizophagus irregularis]GET54434.1 hypothetical protein RIR_jg4035.t1 [Rhizophagus irregularis DAOM 181602=DAOM 197198]